MDKEIEKAVVIKMLAEAFDEFHGSEVVTLWTILFEAVCGCKCTHLGTER